MLIDLKKILYTKKLNYYKLIQPFMPIEKQKLQKLISEYFPEAKVSIDDLKGDGDHYSATIISKIFEGKSRIEQHKMVYEALQGKMGDELHALMIKTRAS